MSKKSQKALNEKFNVKLPENLSKESILEQLENVQQEEKIIEIPKKKNTAKKLIPIAASLALVVGLLGIYFGAGLGDKLKAEENTGDKTEVVRYQSYDKIYDKFDDLRKDYEKNDMYSHVQDIFNSGTDADTALPEASEEEMWGESAENGAADTSTNSGASNSASRPSNEYRDDAGDGEITSKKDYSQTNTQEQGVDEGDIIKTDGKYLYIANGNSKSVSIVDVTGEEMKIAAQLELDSRELVSELYVNGDRLVILGSASPDNIEEKAYADGTEGTNIYDYAYAVRDTFVKVYNVSDRTAPELVTEYSQQGNYDNSRMIGTKLYCISTYYVDIADDDYRDNCIPETEINGVCEKVEAGCISIVEDSSSSSYAVITALDVQNGTEPSCEAILGNCDELYASAKGLFISETLYGDEELTKIYRFEYTDTGVNYKCMGKVDGYINDQFSMSYDGEYFRIATTVNKTTILGDMVSSSLDSRVNNLYILNNNMQMVGKVENLAKGETIESVRFVGNMAYVVTFRQTDPLFVIDLSDPENPKVKGELKIPGFSEYLHPIADGLLVGVGNDGTESGTNGDCKVSLFDVSDPYNPTESSVLTVSNGTANCYPSVAENHKLYIKLSEDEFAVPFHVHKYVEAGDYLTNKSYVCYIRYWLTGTELCEVARYEIAGIDSDIMGAAYVGNTFYVVVNEYDYYDGDSTYIVAYDLTTNEEIGRIQTLGE